MSLKEIRQFTAVQLAEKIKHREISVTEGVQASLEQIRDAEPEIHSYVTVEEEGALQQAAEIQKKLDRGELDSILAGVPMAVKDNLCTEGLQLPNP